LSNDTNTTINNFITVDPNYVKINSTGCTKRVMASAMYELGHVCTIDESNTINKDALHQIITAQAKETALKVN
jgi:hypothetical protein